MLKKLEAALKKSALANGYKKDSAEFKRYVQGTLKKIKEGKKNV